MLRCAGDPWSARAVSRCNELEDGRKKLHLDCAIAATAPDNLWRVLLCLTQLEGSNGSGCSPELLEGLAMTQLLKLVVHRCREPKYTGYMHYVAYQITSVRFYVELYVELLCRGSV